jgi:hypothetical protein
MRNPVYAAIGTVLLLVAGCVTVKSTTLRDGSQGYLASCGGTGGEWGQCYEAAGKACPNGFDILDREQFVLGTVQRNLYFKCKS